MEYKDYYKILGVSREAKEDEIKRAYRKLARKYHPDVSKEANAEEHFKAVQEAYEVLKDPQKRAAYNQLGSNWKNGQEFRPPPNWEGFGFGGGESAGGHEDFSDFFSSIFGGAQGGSRRGGRQRGFQQRGQDEHAKISISLEDAFKGGSRNIQLQVPEYDHEGRGYYVNKTIKVTIPPGIISGKQLRLANQGAPGIGGGPAGDLFLEIDIKPHPLYTLQGKDIYLTLPITPWEAALGAQIPIPTLAGTVQMKIAPGSQAGQKLRLKGRGLPGNPASGDQYALLQIVTPPADTAAEKAVYEKMSQEMSSFNPRKGLI